MVDVNQTGMWNDAVLTRVIAEMIKKVQSSIHRQPVLFLLDSYGTHKKHVEAKSAYYKKMNIFFSIIPPNMTGLLQPLDVAINRSFQQHYSDRYNESMSKAVQSKDASLQTKSGNVKMPKYSEISIWIAEWIKLQPKEKIAKAFTLCGLVASETFSLADLHGPLRDCFAEEFSLFQWERDHAGAIENSPDIEETFEDVILYNIPFSFYKAQYESSDDKEDEEEFDLWCGDFKNKVSAFIDNDPMLAAMHNNDKKLLLNSGK